MGTNISTVINTTIVKNTMSTAVSSLQQISQENSQFGTTDQIVDITINGKLTCASLTVDQESKVSLRTWSAATADQTLQMCQQVAQDLASNAKTTMDQANSKLNFLQTNLSTTVNTAIEETNQSQIVAMTQAFNQTVSQTSNTTQHIIFTVGDKGEVFITGACTFTQTSTIDYTATQIVDAAMNVITSQAAVQKAATEWDTQVTQKNTGVDLALILGLFFGILAFLVLIGLLVYFLWYRPRQKRKEAEAIAAGGGVKVLPEKAQAKPPKSPKAPKSPKVKPQMPSAQPTPLPKKATAPVVFHT